MLIYVLIFIIIFAGALAQGITGFGAAMIWMSFLPLLIPLPSALAIVPLMETVIGIQISIKLCKNIKWKMTIIPLVVSIASTSLGVWILSFTTTNTMRFVVGSFIFLIGVYFFATSKRPIKILATNLNGGIAGLVAGIFTGLLNIGGPPLAIYYSAASENPIEYKANIEFNFLIMYGWATLLKVLNGQFKPDMLKLCISGLVAVIIGSFVGLKFFYKFEKKLVSRLVWGMLIIMGLYQLANALVLQWGIIH